MAVDLSIVIVSWNVADLLTACLESVYRSVQTSAYEVEVIVVDSASSDDTVERVKRLFPQVTLSAQTENLGFVRCNNIGLKLASGRHMMLLNPDTEIIGDALAVMLDYLDAHPQVGMIGPHTLNTDGTHQSSRRRFPNWQTAFFESTWLQGYAPHAWLDRYYVKDQPDAGVYEVDWVQGSALIARREVYEQIGDLDHGYVMYFEELDWCKRAKDAGWSVVYHGGAKITHHGGKSTDQVGAKKHIYFQSSKIRYFYKHHGVIFAAILWLFLMASYALQIVQEALKSSLGSQAPMRHARIRTYWQVLRSGLRAQG